MEAGVKKKMVIATFYLTILTFFEFMPYNVSNLPDINSQLREKWKWASINI